MAIKRIEIELDVGEINFAIHEYVKNKYANEISSIGEFTTQNVQLVVGPSIKNGVGFQPKCEGALVTIEEAEGAGPL